ncbi:MAG: dethiobiotin synthase [Crocinitomicaceae bacterium]|nr:dethiobiotin synthase [Crocinitomicaceae bacterium]
MQKKTYVIAGIGTDVGKTVVSSIFAEALSAAYWKPVQAGDLDNSDSIKVGKYCSENVTVLPERHLLKTPASPHLAAKIDGIQISLSDFKVPETEKNLIIECAGGLMVPFNEKGDLYLDLLEKWKLPVILVSRNYLGSINHTLLSLEVLKHRNIPVEILVFVGDSNESTKSMILTKFPIEKVVRIPMADVVDSEFVQNQAALLQMNLGI